MNFPQKAMVKQFIKEDMNPDTIILMGKDWLVTDVGSHDNHREFYLYEQSASDSDYKDLWQTDIFYNGDTKQFEWSNDSGKAFASFVEPYLLAIINKKV